MNTLEQRGWSEELLNNWPDDMPQPQAPASWLPSARRAEWSALQDIHVSHLSSAPMKDGIAQLPRFEDEAMRYTHWRHSRYVIPEEPANEVWESIRGEGPAAQALAYLSLSALIPFRDELMVPDLRETQRKIEQAIKNPGSSPEEIKQLLSDMAGERFDSVEFNRRYKEADTRRNDIIRRFEQEYLGLPPLEIADDDENIFGTSDLRLTEDGFYVRPDFETKYWWQRHGGEVPTEALADAMGMEADVFLSAITRLAVDPRSTIEEPIPAWSTIRADEYLLRVMPADDPSEVRVTAPVHELTTTGNHMLERILRIYEAGMNHTTPESEA